LRLSRTVTANCTEVKVGPATLIDPNSAARVAPSAAENTFGATSLAGKAHSHVRTSRAEAPAAVVGGTINVVAVVPATEGNVADLKFGAATAVHPNAAGVVAPGAAEFARRAADLADQLCTAARVHFARVTVHVIGRAGDGLDVGLILGQRAGGRSRRAGKNDYGGKATYGRGQESNLAVHEGPLLNGIFADGWIRGFRTMKKLKPDDGGSKERGWARDARRKTERGRWVGAPSSR